LASLCRIGYILLRVVLSLVSTSFKGCNLLELQAHGSPILAFSTCANFLICWIPEKSQLLHILPARPYGATAKVGGWCIRQPSKPAGNLAPLPPSLFRNSQSLNRSLGRNYKLGLNSSCRAKSTGSVQALLEL